MLHLKGMLVGINKTEKMVTSTGKPYQVLQILVQDDGRSSLYMVRDYGLENLPLNKVVDIPIYGSAYKKKNGDAGLSWVVSRPRS